MVGGPINAQRQSKAAFVAIAESAGTRRTFRSHIASINGFRPRTFISVGTVSGNRLAWSLSLLGERNIDYREDRPCGTERTTHP